CQVCDSSSDHGLF
nr:immunoglobulin light chain junction region [Macaca mulatta]